MLQPVRGSGHDPLRALSPGAGRGTSTTHTPARRLCAARQPYGSGRVPGVHRRRRAVFHPERRAVGVPRDGTRAFWQ